MKLSLDIKDDKAAFFLELLKNFPFVKVRPSQSQISKNIIPQGGKKKPDSKTLSKATLVSEIEEAVEELKLILEGKKQAHKAEDFLNEL